MDRTEHPTTLPASAYCNSVIFDSNFLAPKPHFITANLTKPDDFMIIMKHDCPEVRMCSLQQQSCISSPTLSGFSDTETSGQDFSEGPGTASLVSSRRSSLVPSHLFEDFESEWFQHSDMSGACYINADELCNEGIMILPKELVFSRFSDHFALPMDVSNAPQTQRYSSYDWYKTKQELRKSKTQSQVQANTEANTEANAEANTEAKAKELFKDYVVSQDLEVSRTDCTKTLRMPWFTIITMFVHLVVFVLQLAHNKMLTGSLFAFSSSATFGPANLLLGPSQLSWIRTGGIYVPCTRSNVPQIFRVFSFGSMQLNLMDICGIMPFNNPNSPDQFYRLLSSVVQHANVVALLVTLFTLWFVVRELEVEFGPTRVATIWLLAGVFGSFLAGAVVPVDRVYLGPGASVCAVAMVSCWALGTKGTVKQQRLRVLVAALSAVSIILIGLLPGVENAANLGGIFFGMCCGVAAYHRPAHKIIRPLGAFLALVSFLFVVGYFWSGKWQDDYGITWLGCIKCGFWRGSDILNVK